MLKHLLTVLGMTLALTGCQTQQEKQLADQMQRYTSQCLPHEPRLQCASGAASSESSPRESRACRTQQLIVNSCSRFVTSEVYQMIARGDQPKTAAPPRPAPHYSPGTPSQIIINADDVGDEIEGRILVNTHDPAAYLQSAEKAEKLVKYMLQTFEIAAMFHIKAPHLAPKSFVIKKIDPLRSLIDPLSGAVAAGEALQEFYLNSENRPRTVFDELATELVQHLNPRDPILQQAVEQASLLQVSAREHLGKAEQARLGTIQFQRALTEVSHPFEEIIEFNVAKHQLMLKRQREMEAWERQNAKQRRAQGGSCSCAGSNVCYGPRGGRYCITSGGNKRYGI